VEVTLSQIQAGRLLPSLNLKMKNHMASSTQNGPNGYIEIYFLVALDDLGNRSLLKLLTG